MITKKFEDEMVAKSSVLNTKLSILKSAAKVFSEKGFQATSIRDIAKVADIPHSSITYHFGNKQDLFEVVIKNLFKETFEIANSFNIDRSTDNVLEEFESYLLQIAVFYYKHPEFLLILNRENANGHLNIISEDLNTLKQIVVKHLSICQDLGVMVDIPVSDLQPLFSGAFQSIFLDPNTELYDLTLEKAQFKLKTHVYNVVKLLKG